MEVSNIFLHKSIFEREITLIDYLDKRHLQYYIELLVVMSSNANSRGIQGFLSPCTKIPKICQTLIFKKWCCRFRYSTDLLQLNTPERSTFESRVRVECTYVQAHASLEREASMKYLARALHARARASARARPSSRGLSSGRSNC